jgi:two-component system sensor histidine kinase KdpD
MYDFSRGLILGKEDYGFTQQIVKQVVDSFQVRNACFYDSVTTTMTKFDESAAALNEKMMVQAAASGSIWRDPAADVIVVPVKLGGARLGSLAIVGETIPSEVALQAIAQLVAIAIERARVREVSARMEVTRQNEQLKSTLLDALAHEFKTPLTSVKGATTTLLSSSLSPADQRALLAIVDEEADRMTLLVSDSIELARMGTAPIVLNKEVCSAEQLIFSAVNAIRGLLEGRELKVDIVPDIPFVFVDKSLSELALRQVLNNALKYSPSDSEVKLKAQGDDHFVVISVSNLGAGINRVEQARIFDKFYRGLEVRNRIPGTGMGLSITRDIIESQGGLVLLKTEPDKGVTFSITLPISQNFESREEHLQRA